MSEPKASLTLDEVRHVAVLARLAISDEQLPQLQRELTSILGHIEQLRSIDTTGLEPMAHPLTLSNRLAEDVPEAAMQIAELLRNAPATEGDFLVVPKVLGGESS